MSQINKLLILSLTLISLSHVLTYDLGTVAPCQSSSKQQSPIEIHTGETKYREERFFRILSSNYTNFNTSWVTFNDEKTVGFQGNDMGYVLFLKNWSIYKFNLEKILFRYGSAHSIDGMTYDVEMELVHRLDTGYRTPGRYIHPTAEYLIISSFFVVKANENEDPISLFFETVNLATYSSNLEAKEVYFKTHLKMNHVVANNPGYFYEGTTTSGFCDTAWRLILPKFQLISVAEHDQLKSVLVSKGFLDVNDPNSHNYRTLQPLNAGVEVYKGSDDPLRLLIAANSKQYSVSIFNWMDKKILVLILGFLLFFN